MILDWGFDCLCFLLRRKINKVIPRTTNSAPEHIPTIIGTELELLLCELLSSSSFVVVIVVAVEDESTEREIKALEVVGV
jgi:hypothetical protein